MTREMPADNQDRRTGLLHIRMPFEGKPAAIDFDIDGREYATIGYAIVQWSFLEHQVLQSTIAMFKAASQEPPDDARQDSFRRRLSAFRTAVGLATDEDFKKRFLALANRIANENSFRQKITHGVWAYDAGDPDILHVEISRYEGGPQEFFQVDRIMDFAQRVGQISFELMHPGGVDDIEFSFSHMSRSFRRTIAR